MFRAIVRDECFLPTCINEREMEVKALILRRFHLLDAYRGVTIGN